MKQLSRRLLSIGLSMVLTVSGSGVVQAVEPSADSLHDKENVVQPVLVAPSLAGTLSQGRGVPETDPEYMDRGGYISTESDINVPVITDDGDYEGIEIDEKAFDNAYSSINLDDIKLQETEKGDEDAITRPALRASSSDKSYNNSEKLPPVRNQGDYETCWAFSALAAVEGDLIADGVDTSDLDLSELHLAYYTEHFNTSVQSDPLGGTKGDSVLYNPSYDSKNYLMTGGNEIYALKALMAWTGAVKEERVPYSSAASTLSVPDSRGLSTGQYESDVHVDGWYAYNLSSESDRILVKDAIVKHGALSASMWAVSQFYDKGTNTYYDPYSTNTNHAISIVGWDDNIPASSFTRVYNGKSYTPAGSGAWLVRNSWGDDGFSYNGYFWLSYANTANIQGRGQAAYAVDATLATEDYDNNYTYDGQIGCDWGWGYSRSFSAANVFTAKSNEVLEAVAFEAFSAKVNYTVDVYTDVNPILNLERNETNPNFENATHVDTLTGTTTAKGYYNLKLNKPVWLSRGQTFAVKVTISHDSDESVYIGAENANSGGEWLKQTAVSPLGEGFGYTNGWRSDTGSSYCIKAYTDNRPAAGLSSVNITGQSNGDALKIGGDYVLKAMGNNNSLITSVTWSSSNESVIAVKERTRLSSVLDVKKEGNATVTATVYGLDSSGKLVQFTKSLNFTVRGRAVQKVTVIDSKDNSTGKSEIGKAVSIEAKITEGSEETNMTWSTSDSSVVSLTPSRDRMSCTVTPKALGNAVVKATSSNGKSGIYTISIVKPARSVTVGWGNWRDEAPIDLNYSSSQGTIDSWYYGLEAHLNNDATDKDLIWSSDNPSIVTIEDVYEENGIPECRIKMRNVAGSAKITARSPYSGAQGSFTFITYKNPVTSVNIKDVTSGRIEKGKSVTLSAEYTPKNADFGTEIKWSITDTGRLSIKENSDGTCTITGLDTGSAYVRATSVKTNKCCDYRLTVWAPVDSIQIFDDDKKKSSTMNSGATTYLTGYLNTDVEPGQDLTVTWTSSDESVASVQKTGDDSSYYSYATVTAHNPGNAVITGTTANGLKDTYRVTVAATPVSHVTLDRSSLLLNKGDAERLTASVFPAGAANKGVRWSSSDTDVADVSDEGKVTARSRGRAVITVTTLDGGYTANCSVTVVENNDIYVTDDSGNTSCKGEIGKAFVLSAGSFSSENIDFSQWTITNSSIADLSVSDDKKTCEVIPRSVGSATITVSTSYGETAEYILRVIRPISSIAIMLGSEEKEFTVQIDTAQSKLFTLSAALNTGATDTDLIWTSDNPAVVTIGQAYDNAGIPKCSVEVQPVAGKAVIKAASPYSGVSDTFVFTTYRNPVTGIYITGLDSWRLEKGKSATLTAGYAPENADYDTQIKWSMIDNDRVSMQENPDGTCKITGLSTGTVNIKASTRKGIYQEHTVTVWAPVSSIEIRDYYGAKEGTMEKGNELSLTGYLNDDADTSQDLSVSWESSDSDVVSVRKIEDRDGTSYSSLTAVSPGKATITATTANGISATYTVTVISRVSGVQLDKTELKLNKGANEFLSASILPSDATDKTLIWSSSDESVATVDSYGFVTAVDSGAAWITVKTNDGEYVAECNVNVEIPAVSLGLDQTSLSVNTGDMVHLTAFFEPVNATNQTLIWESSDRGVVTVEEGDVTAIEPGNAKITARSEIGLIASCDVTVISKVTGVMLNQTELFMNEGDTEKLIASVIPSNATEQGIIWRSNDSSVVTVSENGMVTAISHGNTNIIAETKDGGYIADCSVTVADSPDADVEIGEIGIGDTITYGTTIQPVVTVTEGGLPLSNTPETKIIDKNGRIVSLKYPDVGEYTYVASYKAEDGRGTAERKFRVTKADLKSDMLTIEPAIVTTGDREPDIFLTNSALRLGANVTWEAEYFLKGESPKPFHDLEKSGTYHVLLWTKGEGNYYEADGIELTQTVSIEARTPIVTDIIVSPASIEILSGETAKLTAILKPDNVNDKAVTWKSNDETKVKVTANGVIQGIAAGSTTVVAEADGITGSATVIVSDDDVRKKILDETDEDTMVGIAEDLDGGRISDLIGTNADDRNKAVVVDTSGNIVDTNIWVGGVESEYTYTGAAIKPEPHVYDGTTRLVKGKDYTVSYLQNTDSGTATINIQFKGNYRNDPCKLTFRINPAVVGKDVVVTAAAQEEGKSVKPKLTFVMTSTGKTVNAGRFNVPSGKITLAHGESKAITVSAKDTRNFSGETSVIVESAAKTKLLTDAKVTIKKQTYTGYEIVPRNADFTVKIGKTYLDYGIDYRVIGVYNNVEPGKATVIIKGSGDYTGTRTAGFTINKGLELKKDDIKVSIKSAVPYAKGGVTPSVTVSMNDGTKLRNGVDYIVKYINNKKAGNASAKVTFKGKYKGDEIVNFIIEKQDIGALSVIAEDKIKSSKADFYKKPKLMITDLNGKKLSKSDYTIGSDFKYDEKMGTVTVSLVGKGNYSDKPVMITYRVIEKKQNIKSANVAKIAEQTYTGRKIILKEGDLAGKLSMNGALLASEDFEIDADSYNSNINQGTASCVVRGTGKYGGVKTLTFKIVKKPVKWIGAYRSGGFNN